MQYPQKSIRHYLSGIKKYGSLPIKIFDAYLNRADNCIPAEKLEVHFEKNPVTVFWCIDAGLKYHFISLCILAKTLQEMGHQVLMVRCHQNLARCTVMDAHDANPNISTIEKIAICSNCTLTSIKYIKDYDLTAVHLTDLVSTDKAEILSNELHLCEDVTNFTADNINFGKIALGEVFRIRKLYDNELTTDELCHTKQHILGCISNYIAFEKLKKLINIQRVIYFNDYGNVLGVFASANRDHIPVTNISHALIKNITRNKIIFSQALSTRDQFDKLARWNHLKQFPLSKQQVNMISDDLLTRISQGGFTIYSPKKSLDSNQLFKTLNLDPNKKLLVAFTSSLDEAEATNLQYAGLNVEPIPKNNPFIDQIDWLKHLIQYVQSNPNVQLVVRIHPREGRDVYKPKPSKHLQQLKLHFENVPERVKIIWPQDHISSYDLAELADLILISWTSVGLEMARFGAPALAAFEYCPYPKNDVILWANSKTEYFEMVSSLCCQLNANINTILYAFRWFNLVRLGSTLDIGDIAPECDFTSLPKFQMPMNATVIEQILINHKNIIDINYSNKNIVQPDDELEAIITFIKRTIWYLFTGEVVNRQLHFSCDATQIATIEASSNDGILSFQSNGDVKLKTRTATITKRSPLLARLISILSTMK